MSLGLVSLAGLGSPARAQEVLLSGPLAAAPAASRESYSTKRLESPILPVGRLELGGELLLLTADQDPSGAALGITDIAMLPLSVSVAPTAWLEIDAGTELLIKQAEHMDEPIWQSGFAGIRVPFSSIFAGNLVGALGRMTHRQGYWWQAASGVMVKPEVLDSLRFDLRLGQLTTVLDYSAGASRPSWLEEVGGHVELQLGEREGAVWLGADYYVPVGHSSAGDDLHPDLDPNVRVNLEIGGVATPRNTEWQFYAVYSIIDRGDVESPGSTLPILHGGFDQNEWRFGVQHRFDLVKDDEDDEASW